MVRRVFFSFDYDRDVWRAGQVRNSDMTSNSRGFIDAAEWESIEREGESAIKHWIDEQLEGTTVTVVLIGAKTNKSKWVSYEIQRSWELSSGILGIRIHKIKDQYGRTDSAGSIDFGKFSTENGNYKEFNELFDVYDWKDDGGYDNLEVWLENAADKAGR